MMKRVGKIRKPSASFSLKPKQKSRFKPRYFESPETEHEAPAGRGAPLFSYNLVNLPPLPPVQCKEPEDEELQMKPSGSCSECRSVQAEPKPNHTGMPNQLKSSLENISGMDLSGVRVHYSSSKPAQLNALAYTQGQEIHVAPGQEKHLPHEAWHVVQQAHGRVRPTMQMNFGIPVNDDKGLEHEADVMGVKAVQERSIIHDSKPYPAAHVGNADTVQLEETEEQRRARILREEADRRGSILQGMTWEQINNLSVEALEMMGKEAPLPPVPPLPPPPIPTTPSPPIPAAQMPPPPAPNYIAPEPPNEFRITGGRRITDDEARRLEQRAGKLRRGRK